MKDLTAAATGAIAALPPPILQLAYPVCMTCFKTPCKKAEAIMQLATKELAPYATNKPFNKRMRHRYVWNGFNLLYFKYLQIGFPSMILKQRIII